MNKDYSNLPMGFLMFYSNYVNKQLRAFDVLSDKRKDEILKKYHSYLESEIKMNKRILLDLEERYGIHS